MTKNDGVTRDLEAIAPLYKPWEEPSRHRVGGKGEQTILKTGRRDSRIQLAQTLRAKTREWRSLGYPGVSDTSRKLLRHWFGGEHAVVADGEARDFRYYFCQREAIETLIYLYEALEKRTLAEILGAFGDETDAIGVNPEAYRWPKFAFKLATGAGKTKCMSLAVVWSYFHSLYESDSPLARHFVVVAPGLTVYERLRADFKPETGANIFDLDPLIPPGWRGDWNFAVVLQNETGGEAARGVLYLTNIHRLHPEKAERGQDDLTGPAINAGKALDDARAALALRKRIAAHKRLLVINDEAHHVWDADSAWSKALAALDNDTRANGGLAAQLDFSATPKDGVDGNHFQHIVCDFPLGEAVDAGIVKTPIIGKVQGLETAASDNAAEKYAAHLRAGYARWRESKKEWGDTRKPLLFVMCENTAAADAIASALNADPAFAELNGKTVNLHTNLKGRIKTVGEGDNKRQVFIESETQISDEDLRALRKLSRDLDSPHSPYSCVVSVLMLREGWDVKNVTTIVPLRPYSSKARILPEQTLGRGLRRMTPPGDAGADEVVVVIHHPAFADLYNQELAQEGLALASFAVDRIPASTVSIFPDPKKDWDALDIEIPHLSPAHRRRRLDDLSFAEAREKFRAAGLKPLQIGKPRKETVAYEGRHLLTDQLVEEMKIKLPLLKNGATAIPFFVDELQRICRIRGANPILAPLVRAFILRLLFGEELSLDDSRLSGRLGESDAREYIRAVFVPLIRAKIHEEAPRAIAAAPKLLRDWKSYQATKSEKSPALPLAKSIFNLTPCTLALEIALARFLELAPDVAAFAKNAGPQALRVDYLAADLRVASYIPDFVARDRDGRRFVIEAKGRQDPDTARKAAAAREWCASATQQGDDAWEYVFVSQSAMESHSGQTFAGLRDACAHGLSNLLSQDTTAPELLLFDRADENAEAERFYPAEIWRRLTEEQRKTAAQALALMGFCQKQKGDLGGAFIGIIKSIERESKRVVRERIRAQAPPDNSRWFESSQDTKRISAWANKLRHAVVYGDFVAPIGLLRFCLEFALGNESARADVFVAVNKCFRFDGARDLHTRIKAINDFRNRHVAHGEAKLADAELAKKMLRECAALSADLRAL